MEESLGADLSLVEVPESARIGPLSDAMAGVVRVWGLRELRDVTIPDGVERIGSYWFWGCGIESVEIPASVKEVGREAFRRCRRLKKVVFASGS